MTPTSRGPGLYFHFATASRIFLFMSLRPERRVMVTLLAGSFSQCRLKNHKTTQQNPGCDEGIQAILLPKMQS
jgi:hypothetical protein